MTLRRCVLLAWLAAALAPAPRLAAQSAADAWQALSTGFYDDAIRLFSTAAKSREAELGLALARINRPPVTASSLHAAQERLEQIAAVDDEAGRAARYFVGRMQQWHPIAPDPGAAARTYECLVATGTDDRWCRLALVKLAVLRLTVLPSPNGLAAQLSGAESLLGRTADPVTQRDLHLVIAEARLHHRLYDDATLGHLAAALREPTLPDDMRADLLVQTAQLSSRLGDLETARTNYARFVREFPKDRRQFTVRQALAHLGRPFPP